MSPLINELLGSTKEGTSVAIASRAIGCSQTSLRDKIINHPETIEFRYIITGEHGKHIIIMRTSLLQWLGYLPYPEDERAA